MTRDKLREWVEVGAREITYPLKDVAIYKAMLREMNALDIAVEALRFLGNADNPNLSMECLQEANAALEKIDAKYLDLDARAQKLRDALLEFDTAVGPVAPQTVPERVGMNAPPEPVKIQPET
jgi:hypothetical protein